MASLTEMLAKQADAAMTQQQKAVDPAEKEPTSDVMKQLEDRLSDSDLAAIAAVEKGKAVNELIVEEAIEPKEPPYEVFYKHKGIARFNIGGDVHRGGFQFTRHILKITSKEDEQRFLDLWAKLHPSDRIQIVRVMHVVNEESPEERRAVRGAMGTADIRAPIDPRAVKSPPIRTL